MVMRIKSVFHKDLLPLLLIMLTEQKIWSSDRNRNSKC